MKNYYYLLFLIGLFFGLNSSLIAQTKHANNLGVGVSPVGGQWIKIIYERSGYNNKKETMKIDYENYMNVSVYYERVFKGVAMLIEGSYAQGELKSMGKDLVADYEPELSFDKEIKTYSAHIYTGSILNDSRRIQFPLYVGLGLDYVDGKPIDAVHISISFKGGIKFYLTNKIALYAQGTYNTGIAPQKEIGPNKDIKKNTKNNTYYGTLGFTFSF